MNALDANVVLLAETLTRKIALKDCKCICPKESVGQNVNVILSGKVTSYERMKLYDPNDVINMIGVRIEVRGIGVRFYTAHLKQQSKTPREEIAKQFDEMRTQF